MAVDVLGAEQLVAGIADVVDLKYGLPGQFALHAEVVVVYIGIANALWKNDSGQDRDVRTEWCPAGQVAGSLCPDTLSGIGWRTREGGRRHTWRPVAARAGATRGGTSCWSVDNRVDITVQEIVNKVERVVRQVPA